MITPQARLVRSFLRMTSGRKGYTLENVAKHRRTFERNLFLLFPSLPSKLRKEQIAGVPVAWLEPKKPTTRTVLYLHGGGFVLGSPRSHQQHLERLAAMCKARVIAIDYGLAPENPYPVALEQIQKVWQELIASKRIDPTKTTIMGDSAGGGLALASVMRFRDSGVVQPACVVLLSPAVDGTFSGESYASKLHTDPVLNKKKIDFFIDAYAQHHSRKTIYISPVYARLNDLPPMLVHVGSEEMLLSDSQTIAKHGERDGTKVSLFIGEGMWHGWHFFAAYVPEAKKAMREIANYVVSHTR